MQAVQGFALIVKVTVSPEAAKVNWLVGTQPAEAVWRKLGERIDTNRVSKIEPNVASRHRIANT
jgi:hypothetical protein